VHQLSPASHDGCESPPKGKGRASPRLSSAEAWKPRGNPARIAGNHYQGDRVMSVSAAGRFPSTRLRRFRRSAALRRLVAEVPLDAGDLVYPVFVLDGKNRREPVESMPGIHRASIDRLLEDLAEVASLGIPGIALFPVVAAEH